MKWWIYFKGFSVLRDALKNEFADFIVGLWTLCSSVRNNHVKELLDKKNDFLHKISFPGLLIVQRTQLG